MSDRHPDGGSAALVFDGVDFDYGQGAVLTGVDLTVGAGEVVAVVGSSGAGKSTLLGLADGSLVPTRGTVRTLGATLADLNERERQRVRADIGVVPQTIALPGALRVRHNVNAGRLGRWSTTKAIRSLLFPSGRDEVASALAKFGIGDLIDARTDTLSGGQRQRVALARLVVQQPLLVLADEPVSAIDPAWSDEVFARFRTIANAGAGVLVSVHEPALARAHCDHVVGIHRGTLLFDLPASEVTDELLADLYRIDGVGV